MNSDPNQDPLLLDHEVDGIRELDNKLPRWWVWLFYGTILFAAMYLLYYHTNAVERLTGGSVHRGQLMAAEYKQEMARGDAIKSAAMGKFEVSISSLIPSKEGDVLGTGRQIFATRCAPCHREDGGGLVGPNLTDDYWIHGSNFVDNVTTIWNGVPAKGMITWKNYLKPQEVYAVASYIYTLRGAKLSKPGKAPENQTPVSTGPSQFE